MDVAVNLFVLVLMVFIIWWFWLAKPKILRAEGRRVEILVADGVYTPAHIEAPVGQPLTLAFLRKDASPCAAHVVFDEASLSRELPLDEVVEVSLTPSQPGEIPFTCDMGMYRGSVRVK